MSIRGFVKAVERLPATMRSKAQLLAVSQDRDFIRWEQEFERIEFDVQELLRLTRQYRDSLMHQVNQIYLFAEASHGLCENQLQIGEEGEMDGIARSTTLITSTSEDFSSLAGLVSDAIVSILEVYDQTLLGPVEELKPMLESIRRLIDKRNRKHLDYDRHVDSLKQLKSKFQVFPSSSTSPETTTASGGVDLTSRGVIQKQENLVQEATEVYQKFNNLLKLELPLFFELMVEFAQVFTRQLFQIQTKVVETLQAKLGRFVNAHNFDLDLPIGTIYQLKIDEIEARVASLGAFNVAEMAHVKQEKQEQPPEKISQSRIKEPIEEKETLLERPTATINDPGLHLYTPEFTNNPFQDLVAQPETSPIAPVLSLKSEELADEQGKEEQARKVVALFDFEAQSPDDLGFKKGDVIEVVHATEFLEDWWVGRLNNKKGTFPANYVKFIE